MIQLLNIRPPDHSLKGSNIVSVSLCLVGFLVPQFEGRCWEKDKLRMATLDVATGLGRGFGGKANTN